MEDIKIEENKIYNLNCLDVMREMLRRGVKADWLIADPPYGIGVGSMPYTDGVARVGKALAKRKDYSNTGDWDSQRLTKEYFDKGSKWLDKEMAQMSIFDYLKTDK